MNYNQDCGLDLPSLYLIEGPSVPVVSLSDMKKHLRVDHSDDDDLIEAITDACTRHIDGGEGKLGRALISQTWELRLNSFLRGFSGSGYHRSFRRNYSIELPLPPLLAVENIKYYDSDDVLQTASTDLYEVIGIGGLKPGFISLKKDQSWPTTFSRHEAVIVRFIAGYVDTSQSPAVGEVPAPIIAAIKLTAGTLYANRESMVIGQTAVELPWAAKALLDPYRVYSH